MKENYSRYLSSDLWLIKEQDWDRSKQHTHETQFSQGNGYVGIRGILEEVPRDSRPGTYIAGLYDKMTAQETEIVNLPNPIHFKITANGEKLGAGAMDMLKHRRFLDMRNGLLVRQSTYQNSRKGGSPL